MTRRALSLIAVLSALTACGGSRPPVTQAETEVSCTVVALAVIADREAFALDQPIAPSSSASVTASAATHDEACAQASAQLRAADVQEGDWIVDGVSAGWLVAPADDRLPEGALDHEVDCEVSVAHGTGPVASGSASGPTLAEAQAAARAQACASLGGSDCSPAAGFRARMLSHRASMSIQNGVASSTHDVTLELRRVRIETQTARSSASRAAACRQAYRAACGAETCPEGASLEALDGVVISAGVVRDRGPDAMASAGPPALSP